MKKQSEQSNEGKKRIINPSKPVINERMRLLRGLGKRVGKDGHITTEVDSLPDAIIRATRC